MRVDILRSVQRPGMRPRGTRLRLTGGALNGAVVVDSFNYNATDLSADPAQVLRADAGRIRPDGRLVVGRAVVGQPSHWFRASRLLVEYVGSNRSALVLLGRVIGHPVAGR
ncbi:MAG: hypothetical protein ABI873_13575 [Marmoricola sp.]